MGEPEKNLKAALSWHLPWTLEFKPRIPLIFTLLIPGELPFTTSCGGPIKLQKRVHARKVHIFQPVGRIGSRELQGANVKSGSGGLPRLVLDGLAVLQTELVYNLGRGPPGPMASVQRVGVSHGHTVIFTVLCCVSFAPLAGSGGSGHGSPLAGQLPHVYKVVWLPACMTYIYIV